MFSNAVMRTTFLFLIQRNTSPSPRAAFVAEQDGYGAVGALHRDSAHRVIKERYVINKQMMRHEMKLEHKPRQRCRCLTLSSLPPIDFTR